MGRLKMDILGLSAGGNKVQVGDPVTSSEDRSTRPRTSNQSSISFFDVVSVKGLDADNRLQPRHGIVQRTLQQNTHNAGITRESVRLKHTQRFTRHPDSATKHLTDTSDFFRNRPLISQTQPNHQTASNSQGIRWNRQIHELIRLSDG